ncbi:FadR/GntR family transcriptional regulator [Nonomuraea bangladeshensis]|uniref:FadR/GntR family transcriptional regulator n=1 Tax=Nonomuraea bangladeshensis TaxID=404385 RepID=UPI003C2ED7DA
MKRTRTFEDVLAQIERRIAEDGLTAGDRLPAERRLAEQLGVSRSSVREAMRVLETLGVVSSQVGRGPDAGAVLIARPDSAMTGLLRLHLGLATLELREVIETRHMIEQWAATRAAAGRAAATRAAAGRDGAATPSAGHAGTEALAAALAGMDAARTAEEFVEHDTAFHCALADASGNRLVSAVMRSLRDTMRKFSVEAVERLGDTAILRAGHVRILAAIEAGDPAEAAAAVSEHLADAYPELFTH